MKILNIYDSFFGNTKAVSEMMQDVLKDHETTWIKADLVQQSMIDDADLLIIGSPTRAFQMSKATKALLKQKRFNDQPFFVYDTRIKIEDIDNKLLLRLVKWFGYAAEKMEKLLLKKKAKKVMDYRFYAVKDSEGPLVPETKNEVINDIKALLEKKGESQA